MTCSESRKGRLRSRELGLLKETEQVAWVIGDAEERAGALESVVKGMALHEVAAAERIARSVPEKGRAGALLRGIEGAVGHDLDGAERFARAMPVGKQQVLALWWVGRS